MVSKATFFTKQRMDAMNDNCIIDFAGGVAEDAEGNLVFEIRGGEEIKAGKIQGAKGSDGPVSRTEFEFLEYQHNLNLAAFGELVDSGSNSLGNWIRFSTAIQICWFRGLKTFPANIIYSPATQTDLYIATISDIWYPQKFRDPVSGSEKSPSVSIGEASYTDGIHTNGGWGSPEALTGHNFAARIFDYQERLAGSHYFSYMAVGMWDKTNTT